MAALYETDHVSDLDNEVTKNIIGDVRSDGYAIIRGIINHEWLRSQIISIRNLLSCRKVYPSAGITQQQIRTNFSKWSIGSTSNSQAGISRLMITAMNPLTEPDEFGLHNTFRDLITIRDTLASRPKFSLMKILDHHSLMGLDFSSTQVVGGLWVLI